MAYIPVPLKNTPPNVDTPFSTVEKINENLAAIAEEFENFSPGEDQRILDAVTHMQAAAPHSGHEVTSAKGQVNGYAGLDSQGKLSTSVLPALAIVDTFVVASQAAMLALTAQKGDVALRSDVNKVFILSADDPTQLANWIEWLYPTGAGSVLSVDGRTGAVTLSDLYLAVASKGQANGVAGLDANSKVAQDPANATATPTASKIPIADGSGKLDGWVSDATDSAKGKIQLAGQLSGSAASPTVVGIKESGGQALAIAAIAAGQVLKRNSSNQIIGETQYRYVTLTLDGGGSAISTGTKGWWVCDVGGTILEWTVLADQSGSIVIDVWKDTYANFPPTVADTITASAKPTLSTAQKNQSSTLTGWTTGVSAGDILRFNVDSAATVQRVTLTLKIQVS